VLTPIKAQTASTERGLVLDLDKLPDLQERIRGRTSGDADLLAAALADVRNIAPGVRAIQPRGTTAISLVAADGGENKLEFNPFYLEVVRVVDSYGKELFLDVVSPSRDVRELSEWHLNSGNPQTPLGKLMRDFEVAGLPELSPMTPAHPQSAGWTKVYRDLCEWATIYELICYKEFGGDTLIVRDGLLRSKIFAGDLFVQMYERIKRAITHLAQEHHRQIYLVGIAKHSQIMRQYGLALSIEDVLPSGTPAYAPVPAELQRKVYRWEEYVRSPEDRQEDKEDPKFNIGAMYIVRFGRYSGDPVWTVDLLHHQRENDQRILGYLLADAIEGFPVPLYPNCLQKADAAAQIADFDLEILQDTLVDAVRDQVATARRPAFDALELTINDPAARRYGG
jgi:hypothetical protein